MYINSYLHTKVEGLTYKFANCGPVLVDENSAPTRDEALEVALATVKLASRLGIQTPSAKHVNGFPYAEEHDNIVYQAPLNSQMVGQEIRFLRGWKQYDSCVKGFNALGLLAEHAAKAERKLERMSPAELKHARIEFLRTRKIATSSLDQDAGPAFLSRDLETIHESDLNNIPVFDLALWMAFASRPIVCSTSSNMGISLHQALRGLQRARLRVAGKEITVLNRDEGWLVIWCPDERADFMNSEKTETLQRIESEKPPLTVLHTYLNRKQRDPGALRDALLDGGYFFPTNPQSKDEIQNLLYVSLTDLATERGTSVETLLNDPKIRQTFESLDCHVADDGRLIVRKGVEGGLYGLMVPYFLLLEESLHRGTQGVSTWNQASIGAALAAIVLADMALRDYSTLTARVKNDIKTLFPALNSFLETKKLGEHLKTTIHGVFDIANLQSLAQLLGVVVERHLSGRGTALVGLGSSSYANGNRCYEILKDSVVSDGPFKGKLTFHPMTHTMIPVAQALVYADDLIRVASGHAGFDKLSRDEQIKIIQRHVRKPEPAGAAAWAGYLLTRLDNETLSLLEIVHTLRLAGFTRESFLKFTNFGVEGSDKFVQEAFEEGSSMGILAQNLLTLLEWDIKTLETHAAREREVSRKNFAKNPIDADWFGKSQYSVNIYLTGDNTRQPLKPMVNELLDGYMPNSKQVQAHLKA